MSKWIKILNYNDVIPHGRIIVTDGKSLCFIESTGEKDNMGKYNFRGIVLVGSRFNLNQSTHYIIIDELDDDEDAQS